MFDILVDHPKKRYYFLLMFLCCCLLLSVTNDFIFAWNIMKASSFNDLLNIIQQYPYSYYAYFFYTIVTSPALYTMNIFYTFIQIVYAFIISFNIFDWLCLLGFIGFCLSHKHRFSKLGMAMLGGYMSLRCILIAGFVVCLLQAFQMSDAILFLSRVQIAGMILVIIQGVIFIATLIYLFFIIKKLYLPLFSKAD